MSDDVTGLVDRLVGVDPPLLTGPFEDVVGVLDALDDARSIRVSSRVG